MDIDGLAGELMAGKKRLELLPYYTRILTEQDL